jgi:alpha-galactosidase
MPAARQQWVLDIARPEVADYLFEKIAALVQQYSIDYIKWDMNRDLPAAGDGVYPRAAAQPIALYALLRRLNERFPALEIESCSSGGARLDLGVLAETGRVWTTDNNDPVDRFRIHQAASQFLPPEILGAHIGPECAHLTGRHSSVHTRAVQAMTGQFGFELDPRELKPDEADQLRAYADLYKRHRDWLSQARLHRVTGLCDGVVASALVAADASTALLAVLTERSLDGATAGRVVVPGLEAQKNYRVELVIADHEELQRRNRQMPAWVGSSVRLSGAMLATVGLALPVLSTHAGLLILCERET